MTHWEESSEGAANEADKADLEKFN